MDAFRGIFKLRIVHHLLSYKPFVRNLIFLLQEAVKEKLKGHHKTEATNLLATSMSSRILISHFRSEDHNNIFRG